MQAPSHSTLERRVAQLEGRVRRLSASAGRWRAAAMGSMAMVLAAFTLGSAGFGGASGQATDEVVHARRMMILNEEGVPVVTLGARDGAGWLRLTDRYGQGRAEVMGSRNGATEFHLKADADHPGVHAIAGPDDVDVSLYDGRGSGEGHRVASLAARPERGEPTRSGTDAESGSEPAPFQPRPATEPSDAPEGAADGAAARNGDADPPRESSRERAQGDREAESGSGGDGDGQSAADAPPPASGADSYEPILGRELTIDAQSVPIVVARWVREHGETQNSAERTEAIERYTDRFLDMDMTLVLEQDGTWSVTDRSGPSEARTFEGEWSRSGETLTLRIRDDSNRWDRDTFILNRRDAGGFLLNPKDASDRPGLPFRPR